MELFLLVMVVLVAAGALPLFFGHRHWSEASQNGLRLSRRGQSIRWDSSVGTR